MSGPVIGRRAVLRTAGVAAGGSVIAAIPMSSASAGESSHAGLLGGWLITRRDDGTDVDIVTSVTFDSGGASVTVDLAPPSATGQGSYTAHGHDVVVVYWQGTGDENVPLARIRVTASWHGNAIHGTYTFAAYTSLGTAPVFSGTGHFEGHRIGV